MNFNTCILHSIDITSRCTALGDNLSEVSTKQRTFNDSAFKMLSWLTDAEDTLSTIKQESGNPDELHGQLDRIKSLSSDVLVQESQLEDMKRKGHDLRNSLQGVQADKEQVCRQKYDLIQ